MQFYRYTYVYARPNSTKGVNNLCYTIRTCTVFAKSMWKTHIGVWWSGGTYFWPCSVIYIKNNLRDVIITWSSGLPKPAWSNTDVLSELYLCIWSCSEIHSVDSSEGMNHWSPPHPSMRCLSHNVHSIIILLFFTLVLFFNAIAMQSLISVK